MAEEEAEQEAEFTGEEEKPKKLRKLILMALFGVFGLGILSVGGYYGYSLLFGKKVVAKSQEAVEKQIAKLPSVYFDLPEMVVNLSVNDKRAQYLKIKIALEAHEQAAIDALQPVMPRVLDMFQIYLRELRSSDLEGSAGIFRLKEELLRRINLAIYPNRVNRVLFKEIIIQ